MSNVKRVTIGDFFVMPVDFAPDPQPTPTATELLWLEWAKIAWFGEGPDAGEAVLAYYVALRDGGATV